MTRPRPPSRKGLIGAMSSASCLLLLASLYLWLLGPSPVGSDAIGAPYRLIASDGRIVDSRSFPGRYRLLYFGYTHCRDVCPNTLAAVSNALDMLGTKAGLVQPLFISLDPERDTPESLQAYLAHFTPRPVGLTGASEQIVSVQKAYRVTSVAHPTTGRDYDIDHSSVLYLMSPTGQFVTPIPADTSPAEIASILSRYL